MDDERSHMHYLAVVMNVWADALLLEEHMAKLG